MEKQEESSSSSSQHNFFHNWITLQKEDLSELLQSLHQNHPHPHPGNSPSQLIEKNIQHFHDYTEQRSQLSHGRVTEFFAPKWLSSLENSLLWIAGCRPSLFIRLVYVLTGYLSESQLTEFIETGDRSVLDSGLSPSQLARVDTLHRKTIKDENKLTSRLASLQEDMADGEMAVSAKKASRLGELDGDTSKTLDEQENSMEIILKEADKLRMSILKEVLEILTPSQAVDFLATSKKLHLCVHEWGKKRDEMRG